MPLAGVLLAAGRGVRFGMDKRIVRVAHAGSESVPMAIAACRNLVSALPWTVAVVRPEDEALAAALESAGATIARCERAEEGMGRSLAGGVAAARDADGWLIALADMPWIAPATISCVAQALVQGAGIVAPSCRGQRGHPVGFAAKYRGDLLRLCGDEGARKLLAASAADLCLVETSDPGVLRDVDAPADLASR